MILSHICMMSCFYLLKLQQITYYRSLLPSSSFLREFTLYAVFKVRLVGSSGLEPPTSRLSGVRSNQLSYEPLSQMSVRLTAPILPFRKVGGDERVRTDDPLLAKQVLSQLSYTPTVSRLSSICPFESTSLHPQNYIVQFSCQPNDHQTHRPVICLCSLYSLERR